MVLNSFIDIVGRENFVDWHYTIFSVISSLCIFMFIYSIKINTEKFNKFILWLSDKTFGIYLVHYLILAKIDLYKFEVIEKFYFEILYLIIGTIVTFVLSILIVTVIKMIKDCFIKVYKKII